MNFPFSLPEPQDYFLGASSSAPWLADNILLFLRKNEQELKGKTHASSPHRRHVLCVCLKTRGTLFIDHARIALQENEAVLIPPFRFHYYDFIGSEQLEWLFLTFDTESQSHLLDFKPSPMKLSSQMRNRLEDLCSLFRSLKNSSTHHRFVIAVNSFLYDLLSTQPPSSLGNHQSSSLKHSTSLPQEIQRHLQSEPSLTIALLAKRIGYSESHLRHLFRLHQNTSLSDYVSHFRLHLAINRLRQDATSLIDLSEELGFSSQASFTRFFKRMTSTTPARFRKKLLDG